MARVVVRSHEAECQGHQLSTCLQLATLAPVSIRCSWPAPRFTGDRPWTAGMMKLHLRLSEHCATTCGTKHVINLRGTRLGVTPSMTRCNDDLQAHGKILTLPHVLCERHVFVFTRVCVCVCVQPCVEGQYKDSRYDSATVLKAHSVSKKCLESCQPGVFLSWLRAGI